MDRDVPNRPSVSILDMAAASSRAAALMKALSNEHRLLILCHLIAAEELSVGDLVGRLALSQSALSQHLGKLRKQGLVTFRRQSQTLYYRVCDERAASVLVLLHQMFCLDPGDPSLWKSPMVRAAGNPNKGFDGA